MWDVRAASLERSPYMTARAVQTGPQPISEEHDDLHLTTRAVPAILQRRTEEEKLIGENMAVFVVLPLNGKKTSTT